MYTFAPLPDVPVAHVGFWIIAILVGLLWLAKLVESWDTLSRVLWTVLALAVVLPAWMVSYVWTDQEPKVYRNEQVIGEFVRFVAEGWSETRSNGKHSRQVDVHKVYVVYRINGHEVLFEAQTGIEYPKTATFYKN